MVEENRTHLLSLGSSGYTSVIWSYFFFLIIAIAIPNAPFIAVAGYFELFRPLVNFDYILAVLFVIAGYRLLGILLLVVFMASDIFSIIPQIFPAIEQPSDLFDLLPFVFMAPRSYKAAIAATLIYVAIVALILFTSCRRRDLKTGLIVLNISLLLYIYHITFGPNYVPSFRKGEREGSFISSQIVNYFDYRNAFSNKTKEQQWPLIEVVEYTGELASWYRLPDREHPERLLLIINESWGANIDSRINKALLRPILNSRIRLHDIRHGDVAFTGATVTAELRELCSVRIRSLKDVHNDLEYCLPNRLKQAGYTSYAMHGADSDMYSRKHWYPLIGFDKQIFFESKQWPAKCFSFPGACDLDMREEITAFFTQPGKRFMYWLTLNTHAWYSLSDLRNDVFDCMKVDVEEDTSTCRYLKLQAQFFYGLSELINDPRMAGVTVRVIGDHPPPIAVTSEKHKYFKDGFIGWLQFTIPGN